LISPHPPVSPSPNHSFQPSAFWGAAEIPKAKRIGTVNQPPLPSTCIFPAITVNLLKNDMNRLIIDNMDKVDALCKRYNVKALFVFGSVCTDKFNDKSDIDLLISFLPMDYGDYADNYFELADKFEGLFRRPVDLVTDKSLSNPYFIESVNKTKTQIYG
jgi:uncharacterized protein